LATLAAALLVVLTLVAGGRSPATAAEDFGAPEPGRHVYDLAGLLTTTEQERIEEAAAAVAAAGAPTIVYIRVQEADADETVGDAAELMDAWDVESAPEAKDGLVVFVNVDPDDATQLDVGLWTGQTHAEGNLPQRELQRIVDEEMLPPMREGQVAAGIVAGLEAAAADLTFGPPPPPPPSDLERAASSFAGWPLAVIAVAVGVALWLLALWTVRSHPAGRTPKTDPTLQLPDDLAPALAGALVAGRVANEHHVATLLDLAGRGALALEPVGSGTKREVQLRLVDDSLVRGTYEGEVWQALAGLVGEAGVVESKSLPKLRGKFGAAGIALSADLEARSWWDKSILDRRRPLLVAGIGALALAVVGFVATIVGDEPLGLLATGILVVAGGGAVAVALTYSHATRSGQAEAARWRGLKAGLKSARRDQAATVDLDAMLPYAVALGAAGALDRRLKAASAEGRVPIAFRQGLQGEALSGGFYPYWAAFSAASMPSSAGGAAGVSAGGAAAGGAGAGGST
jgi:uncharacterized membrane protein YgcG